MFNQPLIFKLNKSLPNLNTSIFQSFTIFRVDSVDIGPMHKQQINITSIQIIESLVQRCNSFFFGEIGFPYFTCDKKLTSWYSRVFDRLCDDMLYFIIMGRVYVSIPNFEGVLDSLERIMCCAHSQDGYFSSIMKSQDRNLLHDLTDTIN